MDLNNFIQQTSDNSANTITISSAITALVISLIVIIQRMLPKISERVLLRADYDTKRETVELVASEQETALSQRAKENMISIAEQIQAITKTQSEELKTQSLKIEALNDKHNQLYREHVEIVARDKTKDEKLSALTRSFMAYKNQATKAQETSNNEMDKMRNEIIVLRQQVDILTRRSSELEKLNDVLETSLRESRKEIHVKDETIRQLEEKVRSMERQIIEMQLKTNPSAHSSHHVDGQGV